MSNQKPKTAETAEAQPSCAPAACSASRRIASAHWEPDGWMLFDENGNSVEEWPSDWPKAVDRKFIESKGIEIE